eukprot:m.82423 g.82423  ORF g.82423 m.82423 type:complete len:57 (+) comp16331_c0_seq1:319-489(+)
MFSWFTSQAEDDSGQGGALYDAAAKGDNAEVQRLLTNHPNPTRIANWKGFVSRWHL